MPSECKSSLLRRYNNLLKYLWPRELCATVNAGGASACVGDSLASPLICAGTLAGFLFGRTSCSAGAVYRFTSVAHAFDWLRGDPGDEYYELIRDPNRTRPPRRTTTITPRRPTTTIQPQESEEWDRYGLDDSEEVRRSTARSTTRPTKQRMTMNSTKTSTSKRMTTKRTNIKRTTTRRTTSAQQEESWFDKVVRRAKDLFYW